MTTLVDEISQKALEFPPKSAYVWPRSCLRPSMRSMRKSMLPGIKRSSAASRRSTTGPPS